MDKKQEIISLLESKIDHERKLLEYTEEKYRRETIKDRIRTLNSAIIYIIEYTKE